MKKNMITKLITAASIVSLSIVTLSGCGQAAPADTQAQEEAVESEEENQEESTQETAAEENNEAAKEYENADQEGYVYGTYWAAFFDPEAFEAFQDENETTLAYQNEPAGSTFFAFTETDYETPEDCMNDLAAKYDLINNNETTINGRRTLFATVDSAPSEGSGLTIKDDFYAIDVDGKILEIEEFVTVNPDEDEADKTFAAMLTVIADGLEFAETGDYPHNFMEERVNKFSFDSEEDIIGYLESGEGYAYVNIMGKEDPVLVITDDIFTPDKNTANCLSCYPYIKGDDGKYRCGSLFSTISTGTPIAVSDDGVVYCATHDDMTKLVFTDDGRAIMVLEYEYVNRSDVKGGTDSYGGFIRKTNSLTADEIEIAEDDSSYFEKAFKEYDKLTPINFTVAE